MLIWGKVFGALIGFLLLGPPGCILGVVFGHIFDKGLRKVLNTHVHNNSVRMIFFKTVFQTMGYLAKIDGVVSEREVQVARNIMLNDFNLDKRQMLMAIGFFNEGKNPDFNLNASLNKFKEDCGKFSELRRFFLELEVKAAVADKVLREAQKAKLIIICNTLGIQLSELDYQLGIYGYAATTGSYSQQRRYNTNSGYNSYRGSSSNAENVDDQLAAAYHLLGVKVTDNDKIIKNAYRRLMSKYHPDKLVAKGLPPEMMDIAKVKTQQIAAAYALIMRSKR